MLPDDGAGTWRPLRPPEFELLFSSSRIDRVRLSPDGALLKARAFLAGSLAAGLGASVAPSAATPAARAAAHAASHAQGLSTPTRLRHLLSVRQAHDERGCSQCACALGPLGRPE